MSIQSVFAIVQLAIPLIRTAEEFIRGRSRGKEKKEAVMAQLIGQLAGLKKELLDTAGDRTIDYGKYEWVNKGVGNKDFLDKVSNTVDVLVDFGNYIEKMTEKEETKEEKELIN